MAGKFSHLPARIADRLWLYRQKGNFRGVQFSRIDTDRKIRGLILTAKFRGQYQSVKIKIREIVSCFCKISVEELLAYMVEVCGSDLLACGKTSNMQLSQDSLSQ